MPGEVLPARMALSTDEVAPSPDRSLVRHLRVTGSRNRSLLDHDHDHSSLSSDLLSVASDYSSRASRYWRRQQYDKALNAYQEALDIYRRDAREPENSRDVHVIVDKCNAAATLHNMGLVHKRCRRYQQAIRCFQEAESLYQECTRAVLPLHEPQPEDEYDSSDVVRELCLEQMLAETLQTRAGIHSRYLNEVTAAIECHEEVVALLLGLDKSFDDDDQDRRIASGRFYEDNGSVVFVKMNDSQRAGMLSVSLKDLGCLQVQSGDNEEALTSFSEAMEILRCKNHETPNDTEVQKTMCTILMNTAAIYFEQEELDLALLALQNSIDIRLAIHNDPTHPDVLAAMNNIGIVHEKRGDLDSALECYENVLMLRAQSLGESHVDVAKSLKTVGAVMAMQGNWVGALDIYEEGLRIFWLAATDEDVAYLSDVIDVLCRMASLYLENEFPDDAIRIYQEALKAQRSLTGESHTNIALFYQRIGQVYMEKKSYHAGHQYFLQSLRVFKANGMTSKDPQVSAVMKDIETAQRLQEKESMGLQSESETSDDLSLVWDPSKEDYIPALPSFPEKGDPDISIGTISNCSPIKVEGSPTGKNVVSVDSPETSKDSVDSPEESALSFEGAVHVYTNRPNTTVSDISDSNVESSAFTTDHESENDTPDDEASRPLSTVLSEPDDTHEELSTPDDEAAMIVKDGTRLKGHDGAVAQSPPEKPVDSPDLETNLDSDPVSPPEIPRVVSRSEFESEYEAFDRSSESEYVTFDNASNVPLSDTEDDGDLNDENARPEFESRGRGGPIRKVGSFASNERETVEDVPIPPPPMSPDDSNEYADDVIMEIAYDHDEPDENISAESNRILEDERRRLKLSPSQSLKPSNPKHSKTSAHKMSKASPRNRISKAFTKRFRRGSQSPRLDSMPEEGAELPVVRKEKKSHNNSERSVPVRFIAMREMSDFSDDDAVSQITFTPDEYMPVQSYKEGDSWWGVTGGSLEGWLPTSYVKKAVEVAEEFLSASTIHDKQMPKSVSENSSDRLSGEESTPSAQLEKLMKDMAAKPMYGLEPAGSTSAPLISAGTDEEKRDSAESRQAPEDSPDSSNDVKRAREFDYLLGKIDVVHGEMTETDGAMPFIEVVNKEQIEEPVDETPKATSKSRFKKKKRRAGGKGPVGDASFLAVDDSMALYGEEQMEIPAELVAVAKLHSTTLLEAFRIQKKELGDHEDVARSCSMLADMCFQKKDYKSALEYYTEAHRIEEVCFGKDRPENARNLNCIGKLLAKRGEFDSAMENLQRALTLVNNHYGDDVRQPLVSQTLICIGAVYYKERNSLSTIRSKKDGCSGFIKAVMLGRIGRAHEQRGSYRMAVAFFEEKLQLMQDNKETDDQHEVAMTLKNLGTLSCKSGHFLEALDYYNKALAIQQKLGCDQLQLAEARVLKGIVEVHLGQFGKAHGQFQDALLLQRGIVGNTHESVALTLYQIGIVRVALFEYDGAMKVFEEALAIQKDLLGMDHEATLQTRLEIAKLLSDQYQVDTALERMNEILESQRRLHGAQHPHVAETLYCIGKAQFRNDKLSDALKTYEECFFMREKFLGIDHPLVASTLHSIAAIHARNGRFEKSLRILKNVLNIRKETLGEKHLEVARTLASQGSSRTALGHIQEATDCYNRALPIAEKAVGKSHPSVGDIHVNMSNLLLRKCQFEDAKKHVRKALEVYKLFHMRDDHPRIVSAMRSLDRIEREELLLV